MITDRFGSVHGLRPIGTWVPLFGLLMVTGLTGGCGNEGNEGSAFSGSDPPGFSEMISTRISIEAHDQTTASGRLKVTEMLVGYRITHPESGLARAPEGTGTRDPYSINESVKKGESLALEVTVIADGYPDWVQEIQVEAGSDTLVLAIMREGSAPAGGGRSRTPAGGATRARETPPPPSPTPPTMEYRSRIDAPLTRSLSFRTVPRGASVRVFSMGNDDQPPFDTTAVSPLSLQLPTGLYQYEVSHPGYSTESSDLDLRFEAQPDFAVTLTPIDVAELLRELNLQMENGNCIDPIQLLENVTRPGQMDGEVGRLYQKSRILLGNCFLKDGEYQRSISTFDEALSLNVDQYAARIGKGQALCSVRDFTSGKRVLAELRGRDRGIAADSRGAIRAIAQFEIARCLYYEYRAAEGSGGGDIRVNAISNLRTFMVEAEDAMGRASTPPDLVDRLRSLYEAAQDLDRELTGGL